MKRGVPIRPEDIQKLTIPSEVFDAVNSLLQESNKTGNDHRIISIEDIKVRTRGLMVEAIDFKAHWVNFGPEYGEAGWEVYTDGLYITFVPKALPGWGIAPPFVRHQDDPARAM